MIAKRYRTAAAVVIGVMGLGGGMAAALTPPAGVSPEVGKVAAADPASKDACPSADAYKEANKLVLSVYKDQIAAAKVAAQKGELARKMLEAARDDHNAAERYALLSVARDYANEAVDVETLWNVMKEFDRTFVVDGVKIHADVVLLVSRNVRLPEQRRVLVQWVCSLVDTSIAADRYEVAQSMEDVYLATARGLNDQALQKDATATVLRVRELSGAYEVVRKSIEVLAAHPSDAEANLKVGRFRCFFKGDWKNGLPMLAIGSDKGLASLAQLELRGNLTDDEVVKLGDGWWDAGALLTGTSKLELQQHANVYYVTVFGRLSGLAKVKVDMRLKEVGVPVITTGTAGAGGTAGTGSGAADGGTPRVEVKKVVHVEDEDVVTMILNKIPKQDLPTKTDVELDLRAKTNNLEAWLRTNKFVETGGTHMTFYGDYEDSSIVTSGADRRAGLGTQTVTTRFEQHLEYNGIPTHINLTLVRTIPDTDADAYQQAKQLDKEGRGVSHTVGMGVTSVTIQYHKGASGPEIEIFLTSQGPSVAQRGGMRKQ